MRIPLLSGDVGELDGKGTWLSAARLREVYRENAALFSL